MLRAVDNALYAMAPPGCARWTGYSTRKAISVDLIRRPVPQSGRHYRRGQTRSRLLSREHPLRTTDRLRNGRTHDENIFPG